MPVINSFTVTPAQADPGDTVTIHWDTTGAKRVVIGGLAGLKSQPAKGDAKVVIQQSTTYVLQAINGTRIARKIGSVRVASAPGQTFVPPSQNVPTGLQDQP